MISGTATPGSRQDDADYQDATISFHWDSADIFIDVRPFDDIHVEPTETVVAEIITQEGCGYELDTSYIATVYIHDNDGVNSSNVLLPLKPIDCFCTCPTCDPEPTGTKQNSASGGVAIGNKDSKLAHHNPTESFARIAQSVTLDADALGTQANWSPSLIISGGQLQVPESFSLTNSLSYSQASNWTGTSQVLKVAPDITLSTGRYKWEISPSSGAQDSLASGYFDIIDWSFSEFGRGWYPEYLSRLFFSGDGFSWLQGNNNLFWYDGTSFEDGETGFSTVGSWSGGVQITTREDFKYRYDELGLLVETEDRNGNTTKFEYADKDGDSVQDEIVRVKWPVIGDTEFSYDTASHLVNRIDAPGTLDYDLEHDTVGRVVSMKLPATGSSGQPTMTASYVGTTDWIASYTDFNGFTWSYTYDNLGGVKTITQPDGGVVQFVSQRTAIWNDAAIPPLGSQNVLWWSVGPYQVTSTNGSWTTAEGHQYVFRTDRYGNMVYLKTPELIVTNWDRNRDGLVTRETLSDPDGVTGPEVAYVTVFEYTDKGLISKQTLPDGGVREWEYGAAGQVSSMTDVDQSVLENQLDAHGNVTQSHWSPAVGTEKTSTFTYTTVPAIGGGTNKIRAGLVTSTTDPAGNVTLYAYDADGLGYNVTEQPNQSLQRISSYRYNVDGQMTQYTDALGRITSWVYDQIGRLEFVHLPMVTGETTAPQVAYVYGPTFQLASVVDPLGRSFNQTYNFRGQSLSSSYSAGPITSQSTSRVYDLDGNLTTETNPLGGVTSYSYDNDGRLTGLSLPEDAEEQIGILAFTYDKLNRPIQVIDNTGYGTRTIYEDFGRKVTTGTSFEGGWADSITWLNGLYQPETEKDPLNHVSRFSYSSDGLLLSLIRENGSTPSVWTYQYDVLGQLIESRNPEQQGATGTNTSTTYAYDALGRLTGIGYPRVMSLLANEQLPATTESFTYDLLDQLLSSSKTGSPTVNYTYDARGRLTTQTIPDPDGSLGVSALITTYQYNVVGQPTLVTNPLGSKEKYEYDALGRLEKYYAPSQTSSTYSSAYTKYSYNAAGLTTAVEAPLLGAQSWTYDQRGQLLTHQPAGIVGQYEYLYDPVGRPTGVVDPLGISTWTSYADNRVASSTDGMGGITSYAYDANGNLTSLTDPVGNETSWQYNALNLPVVETKESGHSRYFEYDRNGSLTKRTDRTGKAIRYTYDLLGQLRVEDWLDGTSVVNQFYYEYGAADQLKYAGEKSAEPSATFPSAGFFGNQVSLTYDSWGRVTGDTQQWDRITSKLSRVDYVYSGANWQPTVTNVTYAGASALQSQTTTSYNLRGEVTSIQQKTPNPFGSTVTEPSGFNLKTVTYQRDLLGRTTEIQRSFKAGTSSPITGPGTGLGYDGAGRIDDITHSLLGTGVIAGYEFTYDADSRITSIDSHVDGLMSYTYDNTHQLTAVTYSTPLPKHPSVNVVGLVTSSGGSVTGESFAYDANGNNSALTVSDDNIVTSDGTYSYVYDEEGRPITRTAANGTVTTYTWDHRGRLVKVVETPYNPSPQDEDWAGTLVTYDYDPLDRRIAKTVSQTQWELWMCPTCYYTGEGELRLVPAGGHSSYYVYDGQHSSLELRSVTNESQATSDVYRRIMHGVAIDEVLAEETVWGTSWALSDHLGTIHDWVDATTGTITHYVYSAFGRILSIGGGDPKNDTHLFGFTGRETDADTLITDHWMYYRARYYNPSTGRFVSQDPIGFLAGDANLYRYVGNEVTGATDPSGLAAEGQHWIPISVSWIGYREGFLTQFEAEYFSGRRSGKFKAGVVHNFGTTYGKVTHSMYNTEVLAQLRAWKKHPNSNQFSAEQVADNIRDGKCWNGAPNKVLKTFNDGVRGDLEPLPAGKLNKMDGQGDTPEKIAKKGRTSMRRRGKEIIIGGAIVSVMGAVSKGSEVSKILENGKGIETAKRAASKGDVYLVQNALIGEGFAFESVYESLRHVDKLFAAGFRDRVSTAFPKLIQELEAFDALVNSYSPEDCSEDDEYAAEPLLSDPPQPRGSLMEILIEPYLVLLREIAKGSQ